MSEQDTLTPTRQIEHVGVTAIEAIERASIDVQIATAHKFPRPELSQIKAEMLSFATLDEETASSCFYTLPRGGKAIQGPSVRLAEIAVSCYGNIRTQVRVIDVVSMGNSPHVLLQAVVHDLEKNIAVSIEKRRRITKKKIKAFIDEDDINLAVNAGASIAYRDSVFKVIPLALVKPVYEQAKLVAVGDVKSLAAKRDTVFNRLKQMGVTEDRILAVVECKTIEDVDVEKLQQLIGLGTALKDGETTLENAFPLLVKSSEQAGVAGLKERLSKAKDGDVVAVTDAEMKTIEKESLQNSPSKYKCKNPKCKKPNFDVAVEGSKGKLCPTCLSNKIEEVVNAAQTTDGNE